jgi:hypothetical protein
VSIFSAFPRQFSFFQVDFIAICFPTNGYRLNLRQPLDECDPSVKKMPPKYFYKKGGVLRALETC